MRKFFTPAIITLTLAAAPAMAGNAMMKGPGNAKLMIKCTGGGCLVQKKEPGKGWKTIEQGPGGSSNFKKLEQKYHGQGFK